MKRSKKTNFGRGISPLRQEISMLEARTERAESLTITMSPVSELARSVTEEWPSASGGWPLGLFAGLLPLQNNKSEVEQDGGRALRGG